MLILDLEEDVGRILSRIWTPIQDFFVKIWNDINDFLLHYMSQDIINIFLIAVGAAIVLFILLAIINRD